MTRTPQARKRRLSPDARLVLGLVLAAGLIPGCARTLTISQSTYVNTGRMIEEGREPKDQTGDPLEITIVCVMPKNLKNEANDRLKPGSGITCKEWYERRPLPGDRVDSEATHNRLRLPKSQIYLMTNDAEFYGTKIGSCLRGADGDGDRPIVKKNIAFDWGALHDDQSVIYVFPKFARRGGGVLEVPPAVFHPPGAYASDLFIKIGVDQARANFGQYVDVEHVKSKR